MESFRDFLNSVTFDIPECEHLGRCRVQFCQGRCEEFSQFGCRMFAVRIRPAFNEHHLTVAKGYLTGSRSNDVQRDIDGGPVQVCGPPTSRIRKPFTPDQPE